MRPHSRRLFGVRRASRARSSRLQSSRASVFIAADASAGDIDRRTSYTEQPLASRLLIDNQCPLAAFFGSHHQRLKSRIAAQRVELSALVESGDGPIVFFNRSLQKNKSGLVIVNVAHQPAFLENCFRILLDLEMSENGQASGHLVPSTI